MISIYPEKTIFIHKQDFYVKILNFDFVFTKCNNAICIIVWLAFYTYMMTWSSFCVSIRRGSSTFGIIVWDWIILWGKVSCALECLATSLTSTHWMPVVPPPLLFGSTKNVPRHSFPEPFPAWKTTSVEISLIFRNCYAVSRVWVTP